MSNIDFEKNIIDFKRDIDFNYISELLDDNNYESQFSSDWHGSFVLKSVFKINNIQNNNDFKPFYNYCEENFNKNKKKSTPKPTVKEKLKVTPKEKKKKQDLNFTTM